MEELQKAQEKRAAAAEESVKEKTRQLEELYSQLDSMAEYLKSVDSQKV